LYQPEVVEEVLELVHLGLGGDAMEGDGKVGAAAGPVRGEVQRVLPVSVRQDRSPKKIKEGYMIGRL
jgi:hypothetical protein